MFERLFNDSAFLPITITFILFVVFAIWQKIDRFIIPLVLMYLVYSIFTGLPAHEEKKKENPSIILEEVEVKSDTSTVIKIEEMIKPLSLDTLLNSNEEPDSEREVVKPNLPDLLVNSLLMCEFVIDSLRKPINSGEEFSVKLDRIYCYSGIRNALSDRTILYEWYFEGNYIDSIPIKIGRSVHWRSWTYKTIMDSQIGEWYVVIKDELTQTALDTIHFKIINELPEL